MMRLYTPFDPANSFRASFSFKGPINLLGYYKFICRKYKN